MSDFDRGSARVRRDEGKRRTLGQDEINQLIRDGDSLDTEVDRLTDENQALRAITVEVANWLTEYTDKVSGPSERENKLHLRERNIDAAHIRWLARRLTKALASE